jgi:hypothetical protein
MICDFNRPSQPLSAQIVQVIPAASWRSGAFEMIDRAFCRNLGHQFGAARR